MFCVNINPTFYLLSNDTAHVPYREAFVEKAGRVWLLEIGAMTQEAEACKNRIQQSDMKILLLHMGVQS